MPIGTVEVMLTWLVGSVCSRRNWIRSGDGVSIDEKVAVMSALV